MKRYAIEANRILGIKEVFLYNLPDNRFDSVNFLDIVKIVEHVKEKVKPNVVFTHHKNDLNIDHRITYQAVLTAFRPLLHATIEEIYSFEVLSSTEWSYPNTFQPNVYFDISKSIAKKVEAMKFYVSELKDWPHPRSIKGVEILAKKRGCEVGLEYAEAFECIRIVRRGL